MGLPRLNRPDGSSHIGLGEAALPTHRLKPLRCGLNEVDSDLRAEVLALALVTASPEEGANA